MVHNNKRFVSAFKEYQHFNEPWDIEIVNFPTALVTPPHYGDSIEVLLCDNIDGVANINGHIIPLKGKQVLYIAPNILHGMNYNVSDGTLTVIKLDLERLNDFVNIQGLLYSMNKYSLETLPSVIDKLDELSPIPTLLDDKTVDIMTKFAALISMFRVIADEPVRDNSNLPLKESMPGIYKIISWTENNYAKPVALDDVAAIAGYSKNYFCNRFKTATGVTYNTYLNNLRIYHACRMLEAGFPMQSVCNKCGFDNVSYFVQLFKKTMGITPKKYSSTTKHTD